MQTAPVAVEAKGWAKSWTIVVNALTALALVSDQVVELISTSDLFPDAVSKWLLFALALLNIVLRAKTKQPLASTPMTSQVKTAPAPTTAGRA